MDELWEDFYSFDDEGITETNTGQQAQILFLYDRWTPLPIEVTSNNTKSRTRSELR